MTKNIHFFILFKLFIICCLFNYSYSSLKFNIPNHREKCFTEEFYLEGSLLIRYDLKGTEYIKRNQLEKVLQKIKLMIKDPDGKIMKEIDLTNKKDKFVLKIEREGVYYICTKYYKTWNVPELPKEVLLGIKISSDFEHKELDKVLEKKDINNFMNSISNLKYKVMPTISSSKKELDEEDKIAKVIISTSNLYFTLSILQLILIFIIALYQIFNLRKFLLNKRLI